MLDWLLASQMRKPDMAFGLDGQITVTTTSITVTWQDTGRGPATVERAVKLLRSGDYKRGIRLLQILETLEPDNPHLHFNLGAALSDRGRFEEARQKLHTAIELAPDLIDAQTTLGLTYAREGRHEEAVRVFNAALAQAPKNPYLWRALGGTLRLMPGRLPDAHKALRQAVELVPTDPVAWLGFAEVCEKLEHWQEATEAYGKSRGLNPPDAIAAKAEEGVNHMTERSLRLKTENGQEMLRVDAILYMQEALPIFAQSIRCPKPHGLPLDLRWRPTGVSLLPGPRFAARRPVGRPRLSVSAGAPSCWFRSAGA
jgi:Flp pilus assembly protein TadD